MKLHEAKCTAVADGQHFQGVLQPEDEENKPRLLANINCCCKIAKYS